MRFFTENHILRQVRSEAEATSMKARTSTAILGLLLVSIPAAAAGPSLPVEPLALPDGLDVFPLAAIPELQSPPLPTHLYGTLSPNIACQALVPFFTAPDLPTPPPPNQYPALPPIPSTPEFPPSSDEGWTLIGTVWRHEDILETYLRGPSLWGVQTALEETVYEDGDWFYADALSEWNVTADNIAYHDALQSWNIQADEWSYHDALASWNVSRSQWTYHDALSTWSVSPGNVQYSDALISFEVKSGAWSFRDANAFWGVSPAGWKFVSVFRGIAERSYPEGLNVTATHDGDHWTLTTPGGTCSSKPPAANFSGATSPGVSIGVLLAVLSVVLLARRR